MRPLTSLLSYCAAALLLSTTFAREQKQQQQQRPSLRWEKTSFESREVEPGIFSISVLSPADPSNGDDGSDTRQRRLDQVARKLEEMQSCRLFLEDMHYNAENTQDSEEKWVCTFEDYVSEDSKTPHRYSLELSGDTDVLNSIFEDAGAISGNTLLRWDSPGRVSIDGNINTLALNEDISTSKGKGIWIDEYESILLYNVDVADANKSRRSRKLKTSGTMKTLIIRIVGAGVQPRASLAELQTQIYGSELSLKTQMEKCSHGQLIIEPFRGYGRGYFQQELRSGIIELRISTNPWGQSDKRMENDANAAASYVLGDLASQFDLVMFAMPPGIYPHFAAYAYIGTPFSYYSSENIENLLIQMHEVGHNLGLQHAGEGSDGSLEAEYGDKTGYMGYTATEDPSMCFNAANNYQLGWYSQYSVRPNIADIADDGFGGTYVMSGVAGYNPDDSSKFVTLRLEQPSLAVDYYVGYNWASGMNHGTQEDVDKVIVIQKNGDVHEPKITWKKAALSVGESYVIENYNNSGRHLTVTFVGVASNDAIVDITPEQYSSSAPTSAPTPFVTEFCDEGYEMTIKVKTDLNPSENKWEFEVRNGEWIYDREFDNSATSYTDSFCLDYETCYVFKFFDEGRDGMGAQDSAVDGYYQIFFGNKLEFGREGSGEWERVEIYNFCTLPELSSTGNETGLIYSLDGNETGLFYYGNETGGFYGNETDLFYGNETDLFYANETDLLHGNETDLF
mmetsp:Transcript_26375/g.56577  ORF Transcript_26375/g.56577 Transcript_26375/m.56577 type:complete len:736 (+) Transcript_26375:400-2607(+)